MALDVFADVETRASAAHVFRVGYADGQFEPTDFESALQQLDTSEALGLVYGSGFEAVPELLEIASRYLQLFGNSPRVLKNLKRPRSFFALLDALAIPHPEVCFNMPMKAVGWLCKQIGGSGGMHVRKLLPVANLRPADDYYFQRELDGEPVSLLFAADGKQAFAIGFNRQFLSPSILAPYRYGGAVGHADLPEMAKQQLLYTAQQLTNAVGLNGLNSLDAVLHGESISVLEVNPRLSASFDLYHSADCNLFDLHMKCCAGEIRTWPIVAKLAKAHRIIYAQNSLVIPYMVDWPDWVVDIPTAGSEINADNPVCTVLAEGEQSAIAQQLVFARAEQLQSMIENFGKKIT